MSTTEISLNTDIGEGYGPWSIAPDAELMRIVTDANVACGFHASDPDIMRTTCRRAAELGVAVGAQVGFGDLRGFGRRYIEMDPESLTNDVLYQLGALAAFTRAEGVTMGYVKAHGALYHACLQREDYAGAVLDAVEIFDPGMRLMLQPGTDMAAAAQERGLSIIREGYIDRAYTDDGLLVPRGQPGAVITDPEQAAARAVRLATEGRIESINGRVLDVVVDSLCIHSDSPGALEQASAVAEALSGRGIRLTPTGPLTPTDAHDRRNPA